MECVRISKKGMGAYRGLPLRVDRMEVEFSSRITESGGSSECKERVIA